MALVRSEVGARVLVVYENRVLLASFRGQTWYFLPGGRVRRGETVENAARREAGGQTGLDIGALDFVGCVEHTYAESDGAVSELITVFAAPLPWAAQIISNDLRLHVASVALEDLDDLDLRPAGLTAMIRRWVAHREPLWRTIVTAG